MRLLWAGAAPALACGGCAWACGAPGHWILLLSVCGGLSGLTGGVIVMESAT